MSTKPGDESPIPSLGLFQGFGVEIEYMIVDVDSLDVRPIADRLIQQVAGSVQSEIDLGAIAWSNELALHVLEMKTNGPAKSLVGLAAHFHEQIQRANAILEPMDCLLLPGAVHPWMDPELESRLWPHEYTEVYRTFDRIFSCHGHGWTNLQSTHINLPFRDDQEFSSLHSSLRALLPLLPALAASSPILEGRVTNDLDRRMVEYRVNSARVPSVAGAVIPDASASSNRYRSDVLGAIYRDLAPLDPDGVLSHEWVNARGVIPRFDRGTLEIRVLDPQECPNADLAVVGAVARVTAHLCDRVLAGDPRVAALSTSALADLFDRVIRDGEQAKVEDAEYLQALGLPDPGRGRRVGEVWQALLDRAEPRVWESSAPDATPPGADPLTTILREGPLARRILKETGATPDPGRLREVYGELAVCLQENRVFSPS